MNTNKSALRENGTILEQQNTVQHVTDNLIGSTQKPWLERTIQKEKNLGGARNLEGKIQQKDKGSKQGSRQPSEK